MVKVVKYITKLITSQPQYLQDHFLIRSRSRVEAAANWPENIFWLEAAAINGAATVFWFLDYVYTSYKILSTHI